MSCSEERDIISKEGNNCIVIKCRSQIVKSKGARTKPWGRPWVKCWLKLKTLKSWTRPLQSLRKDWIQRMSVGGMPVFSIGRSSFSLQTVSYALLKSRSVNTEHFIGRCCKPSSIAWAVWVIWSSQLRPLWKPAWNQLDMLLVSAI